MHLCLSLLHLLSLSPHPSLSVAITLSTQLLRQMDAHRELGSEVSAYSLQSALLFLCTHFFF